MLKYFVTALLLLPSVAHGGQRTAQFTVGMTIVPSGSVQAVKTTRPGARGNVVTGRGVPFREHTLQDGRRQIRTIEF